MQRRMFLSACAAGCAAVALPVESGDKLRPRLYERTLLLDEGDHPLDPAAIIPQHNYVFHYPYATTPCFLLNLGRPAPRERALETAKAGRYDWPGGVGPDHSIVAYSAICAHKLTYPTRDISFISYRREPASRGGQANVIHCCSEHSQYDPARGARVVSGPAPQPLAAILLEYDESARALYAIGTLGGEMFDEFFIRFRFRLALDNRGDDGQHAVGARTRVSPLANYCRQQVQC